MIWEVILNRKMRKYKIEGFEKISEETRRSNYSRRYASCGCLTFTLYFIILVLGMFAFESRNDLLQSLLVQEGATMNATAQVGQTIEMGVIVNCTPNCMDCDGDSSKCNKCNKGMYVKSEDGLCYDCDQYDDQTVCVDCKERDDKKGAFCNQCSKGFVNQDGYCTECKLDRCADCSANVEKCNKCFDG